MNPKTVECYPGTVKSADAAVQTCSGLVGWNLYSEHGGIWLTSQHCAESPKPGEAIVFGGRGFGYPVTSITIGGRFYR